MLAQVRGGAQFAAGHRRDDRTIDRVEPLPGQPCAEGLRRRRHQWRVERVPDRQPAPDEPGRAGRTADPVHGGGLARHDRLVWTVVAGDHHGFGADEAGGLFRPGADAGHRARRTVLRHDGAARRGDLQQHRSGHRAGPVQGGDLAEAVPDRRRGLDAERGEHTQPGQRPGDDPRLGYRGPRGVRARGQVGRGVRLARLGEPASQRAAAEAASRTLAGEEQAEAAGAGHLAGERAAGDVHHAGPVVVERVDQVADRVGGLLGQPRHDRRTVRPALLLTVQPHGQVGQLGDGQPGHDSGQPRQPGPQAGGGRRVHQQQFPVL